ncbi:MAG: 50S ribosomal protein L4 [Microcoleus sp. PH2017_29_MFU_D_A]|jgi:large subunit ribosomal protein L4|uniref:50S ribosomal protein L4 n=1 Tax=unclassified Microcoleus TaxID=2642155 RepID=UPI001D412B72|nr:MULTISPECIES: 50S ribosomal protein L4 [unclassified Microcoleus]MCC3417574.1 50S ribosomal protein L4 [Microcoleus sp. PH2017_07_MST_O_A]MCC3428780.1 50S ribosomal protein L4 [Microcoleus sp. PH2017_04_SCI_O_A]MCC3440283.1 50S ribosomal protein L4 [Microcoleus sp. PH2017_03_ELD_O_A]MCC3465421.1 50S ribosomal protein L4 [Microcoleus sp. PH2017_06_SFM_O_A]MCC3501550.1 50S ribosomal protein L4 [Microcoleus sp. PH2017_19_SFW_U_A]MCC3507755.1 50S ribosomal protein L4 [Microcoleus sp. PH2017_17
MVNCVVRNWQGEEVGETTLELRVAKEENASHIVHRALRRQMVNARQGNACTKTRSEVRGGGRKPWRQKGTGRARAGSIRSPLWRGGGVIFGPKPRDFEVKMNKKERRLALRTAFFSRTEDIIVVEEFAEQFPRPKSKELLSAIARWGIEAHKKVLLILPEPQLNVYLSGRNIELVNVILATSLNVYDVLAADKIIVTSTAIAKIQEIYGE